MKKINNILIFIISLLSLCFLVKDINHANNDRILVDVAIIFVLFIPKLLRLIFKIKITPMLELIYIIFMFLAYFIGSIVNLYNTTWWYDLFAHFISGVLTGVLALIVLKWLKLYNDKNKLFNVIFIIAFALMIASLWEFCEYGADKFLGMNVQHNVETGVSDTMEDMLICFLGSIIVVIKYVFEKGKGLINKIVSLS